MPPFKRSLPTSPSSLSLPSPPIRIVLDIARPIRLSAPAVPITCVKLAVLTVIPETSCDVALFQMVAVPFLRSTTAAYRFVVSGVKPVTSRDDKNSSVCYVDSVPSGAMLLPLTKSSVSTVIA